FASRTPSARPCSYASRSCACSASSRASSASSSGSATTAGVETTGSSVVGLHVVAAESTPAAGVSQSLDHVISRPRDHDFAALLERPYQAYHGGLRALDIPQAHRAEQ